MEPIKVVARYTDGRIFEGHTHNFSPSRTEFHIYPLEVDTTSEGVTDCADDIGMNPVRKTVDLLQGERAKDTHSFKNNITSEEAFLCLFFGTQPEAALIKYQN